MPRTGKLKKWYGHRGYGFIEPASGGERLFVHISEIDNGSAQPSIGDALQYELGEDAKGRRCAVNARIGGESAVANVLPGVQDWHRNKRNDFLVAAYVAGGFLLFLLLWSLFGSLPLTVFVVYFLVSVVTFVLYAVDKLAAQEDSMRIPEVTLNLLALLGGWPGALLSQRWIRHKTRKRPFQLIFWCMTALNLAALFWLTQTAQGQDALKWVINLL